MPARAPQLIRTPVAPGLMRAWSVEAVQAHERELFAGGVDAYGLMERAGEAAFLELRRRWPEAGRLAVLIGPGQNGGDGLVIARLAHQAGLDVSLLGWQQPEFHGSAAHAWAALREALPAIEVAVAPEAVASAFERAEVVVDALFGVGLSRPIAGDAAEFLERVGDELDGLRQCPGVLAVDLPSGVNADTGALDPLTLTADVTVTFLGIKRGLTTGPALAACGERVLAELGHPVSERAGGVPLLPGGLRLAARPRDGHKGSFGTVLIVAGNRGMPGAARLAAEGALRVGAGKVIVATHPAHAATLNIGRPELIVHGIENARDLLRLAGEATAVVVGPGLGRDRWAVEAWRALRDCPLPLVVDADALRLLGPQSLEGREAIVTPHPGEAAAMLECGATDINADRLRSARALSERFGCAVVLKGAGTVLTGGERLAVCQRGTAALATAGSGDVLAGVLGAFVGMGMARFTAMEAAVCVHAEAGEIEAERHGEWGMAAGELGDSIRAVVNGRSAAAGGWRILQSTSDEGGDGDG
ncbi:NAD(P)H-hydrate dehydratase [Guyparkeria hydrothermalis]|uniref:NAD(P)H-hydrate dehydratase n=1 Tax=Guyparkeria hydrothermalis TaxID=923 RepID=UPI002020DFC9|nr:NAD(P)H-hydrate dehydratase [Guyparkeria hydrothermalis]MCL7744597.1 NAD(P)H-hydrate dehydratase [Guyparkeria hydrothermalis]